jgi:hypothetical protein
MSFKSSNSFGYDEVPTKLLKLCSHFISSPLNYIYNRTLFTGVFPNRLKYAIIRPIFRKCNKNDMSNYKPRAGLSPWDNRGQSDELATPTIQFATTKIQICTSWYIG